MTATRDLDRLISAFLDEGATELPERAFDAVRLAIDTTHRPDLVDSWRNPRPLAFAKIAISALALVALAFIGVNVAPRTAGPGAPTGSGDPSPGLSHSPGPSLSYRWPAPLAAGTYSTDFAYDLPVELTFTVGDGWEARDIDILKDDRVSLMALVVENLYTEACSGVLQDPPTGPTAEDLTAALASMPGIESTPPTDAELGGLPAAYLEYHLAQDAGCGATGARIFRLPELVCDPPTCGGLGSRDVGFDPAVDGVHVRAWILDIGGRSRPILVQTTTVTDATGAELAELQAVLDSLSIDRVVPPTPPPQPAAS